MRSMIRRSFWKPTPPSKRNQVTLILQVLCSNGSVGSIRKFQASCGRGRYKKLLLRLEALAPLECSSESTTPRPSRAPCLAAPQKCHRRRKPDATSSDLGSFLLRGKQAYAGLQITPFSDFVFSSSQPFRMLGQGEDTGRLHIGNKLCWDAKPT